MQPSPFLPISPKARQKRGPREFRRYLDIAVGSMAELTYALRLVHDLKLIAEEEWRELETQRDQVGR